ncbi:hypothetical protein X768_28060 [Mesorhizobium sp. LSJC265A00]|nr:hypothetical protein [Mesorhizobium sp. LSJC265A00]ESX05199.1 hypothetical protein X768_28060 [Mesorhizobium sp. LSJC265A00]
MKMHFVNTAAAMLLLAGIGSAAADDIIIQPEQDTLVDPGTRKIVKVYD